MQSDAAGATEHRFAAFRHSAFVRYWTARFSTTFAIEVVSVAVGWQLYDATHEAFYLGLIGLIQFMPALVLVLVTGAVSDRFGRRNIMGLCSCLDAICAASLLTLTLTGAFTPGWVFAVMAGFGVARAFQGPASASLVVNLVPREDFANAVSWNSSAWQTATIVGPVAGGLLYGVSPLVAYGAAAGLLSVAGVLVFSIPRPPQRTPSERGSMSSLLAGIDYIRREKVVLGAISLDLFAVLLGGAVALLPVYARDILHLGPWGLGMLRAAPGVGAIGTALWLAGNPVRDSAGMIMFVCVGLFGLFTAAFGLSTIAWFSILFLGLAGAADMVSVYIRETLLQLWTPDHVRGRVNAVNSVFLGASNELGQFRAGFMAALIGAVPAVVFGGIGSIAVAILWSRLFPGLREARHLRGKV